MEKDCELVIAHPGEGDKVHRFCSKDLAQAVWYALEHYDQVVAVRTPLGTLTVVKNQTFDLLRGRKKKLLTNKIE